MFPHPLASAGILSGLRAPLCTVTISVISSFVSVLCLWKMTLFWNHPTILPFTIFLLPLPHLRSPCIEEGFGEDNPFSDEYVKVSQSLHCPVVLCVITTKSKKRLVWWWPCNGLTYGYSIISLGIILLILWISLTIIFIIYIYI